MPIGVSTEHEELARSVRRGVEAHPEDVAEWLDLHVPESAGGQGFGMAEVAVAVEEFGRALVPGPFLATLVAAGMGVTGVNAVHFGPGELVKDGHFASGTLRPVLGVDGVVIAPVQGGGWCAVDATGCFEPLDSLDPSRPLSEVNLKGAPVVADVGDGVLDLALVIAAAELAGVVRWCLETAAAHGRDRIQFGRPIGQFQAVKHRLSDMLVVAEQIDAVAWDAAAAWDVGDAELAAAVAAAVALDAAVDVAKTCIQILGGIGFTWEHPAHRYLRRALSTRALLGGNYRMRVAALAAGGARRRLNDELPPEAAGFRDDIAAAVARVAASENQRRSLADEGLLSPHWPAPWGRDASAIEQLVIDRELKAAKIRRPNLGVGAWALPTIIAHGTAEQKEHFVGPTLEGEISWCQLFSEPGAGSDLAALSTKAERVEGGWSLTGQKVWTSLAQTANFGICLARTGPEKHDGITYFLVDMTSPGLDIRPLRELTGDAMFNEVFMEAVFVPDDRVVGEPGEGWGIGRTTLANERVSMSSGATFGTGVEAVLKAGEPSEAIGRLVAEAQSLRLLTHRATLRSLVGTDPGAGSSVRKLLGAEHEQRVQELGLMLLGPEGAITGQWSQGFLVTRCLTIAGGTSEVQRNVMAERLLGQPRDHG